MQRAIIEYVLRLCMDQPLHNDWQLFGIGMMRLTLGPDKYLHVFDDTHKRPDVCEWHNHQWGFTSTVIAGEVRQRIILPGGFGEDGLCRPLPNGEPVPTKLFIMPPETYGEGSTYWMAAGQVHESRPLRGTVTLVQCRPGTPHPASAYYRQGQDYVPISSCTPSSDQIRDVLAYSLQRWF